MAVMTMPGLYRLYHSAPVRRHYIAAIQCQIVCRYLQGLYQRLTVGAAILDKNAVQSRIKITSRSRVSLTLPERKLSASSAMIPLSAP